MPFSRTSRSRGVDQKATEQEGKRQLADIFALTRPRPGTLCTYSALMPNTVFANTAIITSYALIGFEKNPQPALF